MAHTLRRSQGSLVTGILLLVVGFVLMMQNFDLIYIGSIWSFWPFILVIAGIVKLLYAGDARTFGAGLWLIFLGVWLYVSIQHVYGLDFGSTWPALIIAWGLSIVWKSFARQPHNFAKE